MDMTRRDFVAGLAASCILCGCTAGGKPDEHREGGDGTQSAPPPTGPRGELIDIPADIYAPGDQAKVKLTGGALVLLWKDQVGFHGLDAR